MKRSYLGLTALIFVLFAFISFNATAQQTAPINIVTTAVPFLRISPDARAGGMGDMGIATSPDASSSFFNLAKTPFAKHQTSVGLTYTPWLKDLGLNDVYLLGASAYHKLDDQQAITGSIRYFSLGNIQFTDAGGGDLGSGRPRELGFDFGYARKLSDRLSIGLALRYINSNLTLGAGTTNAGAYKAGNAIAADLGVFYTTANESGQGLNLGATLSNVGTKISYTSDATQKEYIPANFGIGGNYTWAFDEQSKLSLGIDINKLLVPALPAATTDDSINNDNLKKYHNYGVFQSYFKSFSNKAYNFSAGGEYGYNDQFFFRAGYFYESQDAGNRKFFTLGVGLKYNIIGLNFSYLIPSGTGITRNPLSNTIRFGIIFDIDNDQK